MASLCLTFVLLVQSFQMATQQSICKVYEQTRINCFNRGFEDVPDNFPGFSTHLDLSRNQITETDSASFIALNQLRQLNLSHNKINLIHGKSFRRLPSLEILDLRSNLLKDIPGKLFSDLKNLTTLILSKNQLTELSPTSFYGLALLNELHLDENLITTLPNAIFQDLIRLIVINLARNSLRCFPQKALQPLVKMKNISIEFNCFRKHCNRMDLRHFTELVELKLSECSILISIQDLMVKSFPTTDFSFGGSATSLSVNKLLEMYRQGIPNYDAIKTSPQALAQILEDLKHSKIKSLHLGYLNEQKKIRNDTFKQLQGTSIEKLTIYLDGVRELPTGVFRWLPHLTSLTIQYFYFSKLYSLHEGVFQGLDRLVILNLRVNSLSNITEVSQSVANLHQLKYLDLALNFFDGEIPPNIFAAVPSLVEINLSGNSYVGIHRNSFTSLPNLITLDLSNNGIQYLPDAVFSFLTSLKSLYLKGNDILTLNQNPVGDDPLKGLTNLRQLSVNFLHPAVLYQHVPSLRYLHISGPQLKA
ncbi:leucine-rich repeat-containing protein 15-like [Ptychodera flava]|uniref:leucine-rich repeat-containing protein 15-like n=1 Tax=Ptychodera flava TaxID=63121 RepID=UPI00396A732C